MQVGNRNSMLIVLTVPTTVKKILCVMIKRNRPAGVIA